MTINKRQLVLAISSGTLLLAGLTGCQSNRDGLEYNTWLTAVAAGDGIQFEYFRKPRTRGNLFNKELYGTLEMHFRVKHEGEQPRCVKVLFDDSQGAEVDLGELKERVVVMPGSTLDSGKASPPPSLDDSVWTPKLRMQTSEAYKDGNHYQCDRPDPCAMTQAICAQTGKADDCQELARLRAFRDQVLATTANGRQAIADYYRDTAAITQSLLNHPHSQTWLRVLREEHLVPMGDAFAAGRHQETTARFEQFMALLREHHLHA